MGHTDIEHSTPTLIVGAGTMKLTVLCLLVSSVFASPPSQRTSRRIVPGRGRVRFRQVNSIPQEANVQITGVLQPTPDFDNLNVNLDAIMEILPQVVDFTNTLSDTQNPAQFVESVVT